MRTPLLIAIVGLLLAGSSACTDHVECLYHSDCPAQEMCSDAHKCELGDKLDCKSDEDCRSEAVCTARGCLAKPDCESDASCPNGYRCDRYECRVDACTSAADCLEGEACSGGHCAACSVNADCGSYEICRAARCVLQECRSSSDCGAGLLCRANGCYAPLTSARFEVQEGAIQEIPLPADATVTNAGGSTLGSMRVAGGALQFQAGCTAGSEQVETTVRLSDDSVQVLTSTLTVVDPGAPAAFSVSLTDIPNAEAVQATLVAPAESEGSSCPVKRYSFSWSSGEPGSEELNFPKAEVGSAITQLHAVPAGEAVELVVRATDETGAYSEARAAVETAAVKFTRFELSEADRVDPGTQLEARVHVTNAATVEAVYDGSIGNPRDGVMTDLGDGDYSWSFWSRAHESTVQMRATDASGAEYFSQTLGVSVNGVDETEPNNTIDQATTMTALVRGRIGLDEGDEVDFWAIDLPYEGGSIRAKSLRVSENYSNSAAPTTVIRMTLIAPSGAVIDTRYGPSVGVHRQFAQNLPAGRYYLKLERLLDTHYAFRLELFPPECGNGFTETLAGEPCDGGEYCSDECRTTLSMASEDNLRFPRALEVHGERYRTTTFRVATHMSGSGWVDVGVGDYTSDECDSSSTIELEDANLNLLSSTRQGCARLVRALSAGDYFIKVGSIGEFTVNYAAHTAGSCGDHVVNPSTHEECDVGSSEATATCSADCKLIPLGDPPNYQTTEADICVSYQGSSVSAPSDHNATKVLCSTADASVQPLVSVFYRGRYITHRTVSCGDANSFVTLPLDFNGTICMQGGLTPRPVLDIQTGVVDD